MDNNIHMNVEKLKNFVRQNIKEKTMKNKKFWLGMLVIVLIFGMTVIGCDDPSMQIGKIKITNGTTFNIKLVIFETSSGAVVKSDPIGIPSNKSKVYEFDDFDGKVKVTVNVSSEDVVLEKKTYALKHTGSSFGTRNEYLLSGTNKDTLKLDDTGKHFD